MKNRPVTNQRFKTFPRGLGLGNPSCEWKKTGYFGLYPMFLNPAMDLVLISALFAVISQTLQTVLTNRKEVRKSQKKMQETNKRYKELMKQGGKADPQEVEKPPLARD